MRFKANPDYFRGKPPADALILAIATDNNVRLQKLKANECQIALYPKPDDIPSIKKDTNLKVDELDGDDHLVHRHEHHAQIHERRARA